MKKKLCDFCLEIVYCVKVIESGKEYWQCESCEKDEDDDWIEETRDVNQDEILDKYDE